MNPHVPNCDKTDCIVCESWLREWQQRIRPLYIRLKLIQAQSDSENETLTKYQ